MEVAGTPGERAGHLVQLHFVATLHREKLSPENDLREIFREES